jgi:hypothetical protein
LYGPPLKIVQVVHYTRRPTRRQGFSIPRDGLRGRYRINEVHGGDKGRQRNLECDHLTHAKQRMSEKRFKRTPLADGESHHAPSPPVSRRRRHTVVEVRRE